MEDENGKLDVTAGFPDPDFDRYASAMLDSIDGMIIGRKTYDVFAGYWPTAKDADNMNRLPKYVASKTLETAEWNNSAVIADNVSAAVADIKRNAERDLAVFGSAALAASLVKDGLIDELRILVTPCLLGRGGRTFSDAFPEQRLRLVRSESWTSGTTAHFYETLKS